MNFLVHFPWGGVALIVIVLLVALGRGALALRHATQRLNRANKEVGRSDWPADGFIGDDPRAVNIPSIKFPKND